MSEATVFTVVKVSDAYFGLARTSRGLKRVSGDHSSPEAAEAELRGLFPNLARDDAAFGDLPQRLQRFFEGKPVDFSSDALDMESVAPFHRQVYQAAQRIPWGQVVTYGELAAFAGRPRAARAVGQAMAHNPWGIIVP